MSTSARPRHSGAPYDPSTNGDHGRVEDDPDPLDPLPGGPYDVEFFFDPGCPFAWQAAVWIRRVQDLRGIAIGWRFISLRFVNEDNELPEAVVAIHERGLRFHRVCAAARSSHGNGAVGDLYRGWGDRFWYQDPASTDFAERVAAATQATDLVEIIAAAHLPASLADAADDTSWDSIVRAETVEALRRTGPDVGTPILTYNPPTGSSLFGPVISTIPDDTTALAIYDALRTLADFPDFSEVKRSARAPLDLPLLASEV